MAARRIVFAIGNGMWQRAACWTKRKIKNVTPVSRKGICVNIHILNASNPIRNWLTNRHFLLENAPTYPLRHVRSLHERSQLAKRESQSLMSDVTSSFRSIKFDSTNINICLFTISKQNRLYEKLFILFTYIYVLYTTYIHYMRIWVYIGYLIITVQLNRR